MSWIQKLYQTYDNCMEPSNDSVSKPWPLSHFVKKAHVEVVIDIDGNLRQKRIKKLEWNESPTLIPATESSAGRTAGIAPHPLCEEVGYCAADLPGIDVEKNKQYMEQLEDWCKSEFRNKKAIAVLKYLKTSQLWSDLSREGIFPLAIVNGQGQKTKIEDEKVFIRWRVEEVGNPCTGTWEDYELINSWIGFDKSKNDQAGFCMVTGDHVRIAQNHPRFLRNPGDGAKLISANDFSGYTFRGRFTDSKDDYEKQTCSVGFEITQKAHNALRWLIQRQGYRNGDQVIISWAVAGKPIPDPFLSSLGLFDIGDAVPAETIHADTEQAFAIRLNKAISGFRTKLDPNDDVVVMGVDSATPGRLAITFYREIKGSDFLERIQTWHSQCAWPQNFGKDSKFIGAPSPKDIAETAFGRRLDDKLRKATVERLLPCIIDGQLIPRDLVESTRRRAANRVGLENWEWEKCLGVACALYKAFYKERSYQMSLETDRTTRDYLYGRLLAIAENIEGRALYVSGEGRDTTAARLMQRFADRPFSTWKTIELALVPYKTRLRSRRPGFLVEMEKLLDEVTCAFKGNDYSNEAPLSGEFLLGYHCQRSALRPSAHSVEEESTDINN